MKTDNVFLASVCAALGPARRKFEATLFKESKNLVGAAFPVRMSDGTTR